MAAANEQIGIARAAYYPTLNIAATAGFEGTSLLNWPSRRWAVGGSLSETLFDAGKRMATTETALAGYDVPLRGLSIRVRIAREYGTPTKPVANRGTRDISTRQHLYPRPANDEQHVAPMNQNLGPDSCQPSRRRPTKNEATRRIRSGDEQSNRPRCCNLLKISFKVRPVEDMLTAMARELVSENGVGESTAAVWRESQAENSNILIPSPTKAEPSPVLDDPPRITPVVTSTRMIETTVQNLKFGSTRPLVRPRRRRESSPMDMQFPLF
jgi:hypothetical protein